MYISIYTHMYSIRSLVRPFNHLVISMYARTYTRRDVRAPLRPPLLRIVMRKQISFMAATRAPHRPNQIGLSAVAITSVDTVRGRVGVRGLDLLDGTPVLDIKPYVPYCDSFPRARAGWIDELEGPADGPDRLNYWPPPAHLVADSRIGPPSLEAEDSGQSLSGGAQPT